MKRFLKNTLVASILTILLLPVAASAHEGHDHSADDAEASATTTAQEANKTAEQLRQKVEQQRQAAQEKLEAIKNEVKQKLSDTKRKVCDNHVNRINTIMGTMNDRRQKAFDHITKVYDSVKAFYVEKQLTSTDYESLVASVETAKAAASTSMDTQLMTPTISCTGDQPKADIADFKAKRTSSIDAMQTYRQSVKELIKSVKQTIKASEA